MKLDALLVGQNTSASKPSEAMRAAVLAELDVAKVCSWRADVVRVVASSWLLVLGVAGVLLAGGAISVSHLAGRAPNILGLMGLAAAFSFVAIAPRQRGRVSLALGVGAVAMIGLVFARQTGQVSALPQWVCSLSHLAVAAGPLAFGMSLLRHSAVSAPRAALLGLAVGTTGAILGELACDQGWSHVAIFHVGAWVVIAVVAAVVSRRIVPRSFAP